ncbi:MAG: hypothetical protein [Circular genetic element sp.]|nr:MAG: hypothetical protein [Circular genetic element sp.]
MMMDAMREIERDSRPVDRPDRPSAILDPVMEVINSPSIVLTPAEKKAINDPKVIMTPSRRLVKAKSPSGRQVIRSSGQFGSQMIPNLPMKRTRKKTKMDKTMSRCLKEANSKLRLKNGRLRKGKTMSDVMKMAHRLCRKS